MCYSARALQKVWQKKTTEGQAWGVLQTIGTVLKGNHLTFNILYNDLTKELHSC
jgi:hypothetical protein